MKSIDVGNIGEEMYELIEKLYPICRSITGNGVRQTLKIMQEYIPLEIHEIKSGTKVFDWIIPKEWNINDAYVKNSKGEKIVDFKKSNLHVLNYSSPINTKMNLKELKSHLYTLQEHPDWIPYRTSYYKENWGFCISYNQYLALSDDVYKVFIDSSLKDGYLTYGEFYLKGELEDEILLSCYVCHPSLCNDNLSGVSLLTLLAKYMQNMKLKYSYRFLFIPETIGSITWLSLNEEKISKIKCGLVATCLGDSGTSTYKKTRNGNSYIDKIVQKVLEDSGEPYEIVEFFPWGSDERQFSSPAFNLEIGSLTRTLYECFTEYHTSADDLKFISTEYLGNSFSKYLKVLSILENDSIHITQNPKCEPHLGKRGLYESIGAKNKVNTDIRSILWVLNLSDGNNSLLDISIRSGIVFEKIIEATSLLLEADLLREINTKHK